MPSRSTRARREAPARSGRRAQPKQGTGSPRRWPVVAGILAAAAVVVVLVAVALSGGHAVTEVTPGQLQAELAHKDFVLLNVKTPYIGEIQGTDLWIPYNELAARASELPSDKAAKIVVYCRTGNESGMAVQTLQGLGYTNLEELGGGMEAWTAAGGSLVSVAR